MKKEYVVPENEFVVFDDADILTASAICSTPDVGYYEGSGGYADNAGCFPEGTFTGGDICS